MQDHESRERQRIFANEAGWQKLIKRRHHIGGGKTIPDLAAAPLGTDQEAGGAISTPEGERKYDF